MSRVVPVLKQALLAALFHSPSFMTKLRTAASAYGLNGRNVGFPPIASAYLTSPTRAIEGIAAT